MAYEDRLYTHSYLAASDLSSDQYKAVKLNTSNRLALAGEGDKAIGILQDKPAAAGRAGCVAVLGRTKALAGGNITIGDRVAPNASGLLVSVGSGDDWSMGVAEETGVNGSIITILLQPTGPTV